MGYQAGKMMEGPGEERPVGQVPRPVSTEQCGTGEGQPLLLHGKDLSLCDSSKDPDSFKKWKRRRCCWSLVMEKLAGLGHQALISYQGQHFDQCPSPCRFPGEQREAQVAWI